MGLVQEILQLFAARGVTELTQGLGLDLTDTLSGDIKLLAHLLQSAGASVLNAKAQLQDLFLPGGEGTQHIHQLFLQQGEAGGPRQG